MTAINQQSQTMIQLWTKTTAIIRKLDASLGAIHGIGFAEFMILHHLNASPRLLLRRIDLANLLGRSASGVTKMLNPMEKIGLVSKEANPRDARVSLVKLSATGLNTYQQACSTLNQLSDDIGQSNNTASTQQLLGLLDALKT